MAYATSFLRLAVIGTLYNKDVFTFNLSLHRNVDGAVPPATVPQGVIDAVQTFWQGAPPIISQNARLVTLKLNEIGTDGKYVSPITVLYDFPSVVPGTGGSTPTPQTSLAVTLTTPILRGRAHAGRFYLPLPAAEAQSDGVLSPTAAVDASQAASQLVESINAAVTGFDVAVESNLGSGTFQFVTGVKVGRVLDTIRSRRSAFDEDYRATNVVTPSGT